MEFHKAEWWLQEFLFRHQTGIELGYTNLKQDDDDDDDDRA